MRKALILALFLGAVYPVSATADTLVTFEGGIGVIPVSSGVGTDLTVNFVNRNIVRGVQPAGQVWVIADLRVKVNDDGHIKVDGRRLLLGGGNNIGSNANASVFATLICEAVAPFTLRNTSLAGVPLEANGDFRIDDVLTPALADCASPVLLIRNVNGQAWFAAGIPKRSN
jgi:hypothetical protein